MNFSSFTFNLEEFNKLFPFYLMMGLEMEILSCGSSMSKICKIDKGKPFNDLFLVTHPEIETPNYDDILDIAEQMVILEYNDDKSIVMRGQFVPILPDQNILFIGSPWFGSMNQVREKKLTIDDFAIHDSLVDLLHVLKTQELATEDIKELLITVNTQKNKLKKDQKELQRLSLVASANQNGVLFTDPKCLITWANDRYCKITGHENSELLGKFFIELLNLEGEENIYPLNLFEALSSGQNFDVEIAHYKKDGTHFWGRVKSQSTFDQSGELLHSFVTVEDISVQKEQEDQLRVLSLIAEDNINAVIIADALGYIEWINKSFTRMTGYSLDEVRGKKPGHVLQGQETDPKTVAYLSEQVRNGKPFSCEILNYSKLGKKYWLRVTGQAIRNERGVVTGFFALEEDISMEKRAKEKLRESESRLSTLISNLQTGILLEDENREIVLSNQMFCDMFQIPVSPEIITGTDCSNAAEQSKHLFKESDLFVERVDQILKIKKRVDSEEIELADGQFYERDYVPIFISDQYKGHLWNYNNISERKNYEKTLQIQEAKYRNIIANMNLGLLEVDQNDIIEHANQSFCDISGYSNNQLTGKKVSDIFLEGKSKKIINGKNHQRGTGISNFHQMQIRNAKGEMRWWLISGAPNFNDKGENIGSIGIHLDITEQKRLEQELELAKQKAEEESKAKESFLANMSHEIRTPLNAIVGMVRELSKEKLTQKQDSYVHNAETASQHLFSIVNNILDISKIEAGEFDLEKQHFKIRELIEETGSIMDIPAKEKSLKLEIEVDERLKPVFIGDATRIRQILINLLGNAIKFTQKGSVSLSCVALGTVEKIQRIHFTIKDTGIGMKKSFSKKLFKKLFKKFSQEDKSTARKYGGTGLGITLTYELIQLMHGSIDITSEKGKGTQIDIELSLPLGEERLMTKRNNLYNYASLDGINVLLVEDNKINRLVVSNTLSQYDISITEAKNGKEAIKYLKKKNFDLILMDLQMPVMDGFSATKIIREELGIKTPIIALSATAFKNEIDRCLDAGMDDFITKPFEERFLLSSLVENLGKEKVEKIKKVEQEVIVPDAEGDKGYDLSMLHEMSRGNDDFVRKMIMLFLTSTPPALDQILQAYSQGDFQTVSKTAHRIKPSIDNMGILVIKDEIRLIEKLAVENPESPELVQSISKVKEVLNQVVTLLNKEKILEK